VKWNKLLTDLSLTILYNIYWHSSNGRIYSVEKTGLEIDKKDGSMTRPK